MKAFKKLKKSYFQYINIQISVFHLICKHYAGMQSLQTPPIYFKVNSAQLINSHRPTQEQVFYNTCTVKSTEIPTVKAAQINMYIHILQYTIPQG